MTGFSWKPRLIVAALVSAITYLWIQSANPELERRDRLQATLRIIELRDAELMRDILLTRAGLLTNYDALTRTGQALLSLSRSLRDELAASANPAPRRMSDLAGGLSATIQDRLTRIEYLKSDNALLRNSVMSFNEIGRNLQVSAKPAESARLTNLWRLMAGFLDKAGSGTALELEQELERLSGLNSLSDDYQVLLAHGRLIVEVLPKVDAALQSIIGQPILSRIDDLQHALRLYGDVAERRAEHFRLALYLVAVLLAAYLLYQFALLRSHTLALRRAHASLKQEIGERLQAESWLRESEARLRAITDSAREAIVSVDAGGNLVSWNRGAALMFGEAAEEALGTSSQRFWMAIQAQLQAEADATDRMINPITESLGIRRDGETFPIEVSLSHWTRGEERFSTTIIRDISARRQLEAVARQQELQLIQANKMTALGTLVSGVAHEINNPNQLILLNAGLLADIWSDALEILDDRYRAGGEFSLAGLPYTELRASAGVLIDDIGDGAKRIERIVADLKHYARPQTEQAGAAFSLNEAVERAVRLVKHLIARKTECFEIRLDSALPPLQGDPRQVEQVVVNLLINGLDALTDTDQTLGVATRRLDDEGEVCVEVTDQGGGISPEHIQQLCDPFFTTKQACGGTGLGLAISASLMRAHGGRLNFSSEPGRGTVAQAIFPVNSKPRSAAEHAD
ncbi:DAHL domain-containing protein [Methylomonas sp. MS20]|uniref:DAHL domain-containing protein n=1 Tax=unclassified Methylomonas TaxID=2608980 RepID=UPI0028A4060E|nr:DAHL domain-containing protein [Methylomonas sp. MV1]MDT4328671.1 DAHL domain-containing protein [Methylomonas sp. MV1]